MNVHCRGQAVSCCLSLVMVRAGFAMRRGGPGPGLPCGSAQSLPTAWSPLPLAPLLPGLHAPPPFQMLHPSFWFLLLGLNR